MNMVIVLFLETKEVPYETCLDWRVRNDVFVL